VGRVEVRVVHLGRSLRDVGAASDVDRGQPEPSIVAEGAVANLRGSGNHQRATLVRLAVNNRSQKRLGSRPAIGMRAIPVARGLREMTFPVRSRQIITK